MTAAIQNNESRWTVIANGKQIANGTTIRRNGKISHFVSRENFEKENVKKDEKLETNEQTVLTNCKGFAFFSRKAVANALIYFD